MIELRDVEKRYGPVVALRGVSLAIEAGEFVLISGPSGAGKSTLLRLIYAAERPERGQVLVAERDIWRLSRNAIPYLLRNIGVVFQDFKLLGERSALDNVALALEIRGVTRRETVRRGLSALAAVGLAEMARTRVDALSGGEQQRVAVARALVGEPSVVLADEPTGNLDPERSHDILDLLDRTANAGTTVLVATHDPLVVEHAPSTRIVRLDRGQITSVTPGSRAPVALPRPAQNPANAETEEANAQTEEANAQTEEANAQTEEDNAPRPVEAPP